MYQSFLYLGWVFFFNFIQDDKNGKEERNQVCDSLTTYGSTRDSNVKSNWLHFDYSKSLHGFKRAIQVLHLLKPIVCIHYANKKERALSSSLKPIVCIFFTMDRVGLYTCFLQGSARFLNEKLKFLMIQIAGFK